MDRSRSPDDRYSRSRSYNRSPSRSRSRSRSPSRRRDDRRHRSPSRSRSRSRSPRNRTTYRRRSYSRSPSPAHTKILIQRLTKNVLPAHIREIFGVYGAIADVDMPMNKQFMTNRGSASVYYRRPADAEAAVAHMHDGQIDGLHVQVSLVSDRRRFERSPPRRYLGPRGGDHWEAPRDRSPARRRVSYSSRSRSPPPRRR